MKKTYLYSEVIFHEDGTEIETIFHPNGTKAKEIKYLDANDGIKAFSSRARIEINYDDDGDIACIYEYKQRINNEKNLVKIKVFKSL